MSARTVTVAGGPLSLADVVAVARGGAHARLSAEAVARLAASRAVVERLLATDRPEFGITSGERIPRQKMRVEELAEGGAVAYGITTGFGELARVRIPHDELRALQRNLLLSHACGVGEPLPRDVVRALLLLRANALAVGLSGVRPAVVERILDLIAHDIVPVVPSRGSLGASGDLVPLAHAALPIIGEGEVLHRGERKASRDALLAERIAPLVLEPKEGLALINGTQMMAALLALAVADGWTLVRNAEIAGAMSVEALLGSEKPFDARVARARPHPGPGATSANVRALLAGSGIVESHADCDRVQDAYSLRCIPQVLGAARDVLTHAEEVLAREFASATDNPLVFGGEGDPDEAISGGNFHGEPLALLAAYVAPALAEVAAMSERRVARLVDPRLSEGLPAFLTRRSGLMSGLMIPQYVAAALVLENQVLVHPAVAGNLPTSANTEDFNSNGGVGALLLAEVLRNAERVVAIELLAAAQALDLRAPLAPGRGTGAAHAEIRKHVPTLDADRLLAPDVEAVNALARAGAIVAAAERAVGSLA
ncbi:MAG: histidine ammonia-lyase [Thermoplasmatota archaeon]